MPFSPKEKLPAEKCPPDDAIELSGLYVRLIEGPAIEPECCLSFNALGKENKKKVDPCIWAACSLVKWDVEWVDGPEARVRDFAIAAGVFKYKKYGALIKLSPADGLAHSGSEDSPHVSFWMAKDFDLQKAVVKVVSLT